MSPRGGIRTPERSLRKMLQCHVPLLLLVRLENVIARVGEGMLAERCYQAAVYGGGEQGHAGKFIEAMADMEGKRQTSETV